MHHPKKNYSIHIDISFKMFGYFICDKYVLSGHFLKMNRILITKDDLVKWKKFTTIGIYKLYQTLDCKMCSALLSVFSI